MSVGMILSSIALGISLIVSAFKLFDWIVTADPRSVVRTGKRFLWVLAISSVPCLVMLVVYQQYAAAMLLGAAMLAIPAALNWRALVPRRWFRPLWVEDELRGDFGQPPPDAELARRAAIVLEDYLRAGRPDISARIDGRAPRDDPGGGGDDRMDAAEALAVLGLRPGAKPQEIRAAHRRLVQLVHPDRGGTNYLAAKINRAKDVLLAQTPRRGRALDGARRERVGDPG